MIRRVLIANRGEIALRVIRACRERGLSTVAVYSEADADAPYVAAADRAEAIGPAAATASYLNIDAIIAAARHAEADAIHPGYGFLSENASFAKACEDAGITFIGPPSAVIARAGSKTAARQLAQKAGVPVVPGATPAEQSDDALAKALEAVGFPALLKAASGGGGRGMRVVRSAAEANEAIGAARREVQRAFGNSTIFVERLVERPRHVEVQILADTHGHVVHLFERDCTLQRRYQKVIEEAPGPTLTPRTRERLTAAAVSVARAVGYVNAGTCEFLVDGTGDDAPFYFLEMNSRLQVEHPVTESVTGIDLVQAQLAIANGEPLAFAQSDIKLSGHAIECRIYAEDSTQLLPQSGTLLRYREPTGPGVRVDSGTREGHAITVHYDPMIAKLITFDADRPGALERMNTALRTFEILGVRHNIAFLLALIARPEVAASTTYTRFIEDHLSDLTRGPSDHIRRAATAMAAYASLHAPIHVSTSDEDGRERDPWVTLGPIDW
jgi:acetyl-CoA carboxylase biotin carboxylase subunit